MRHPILTILAILLALGAIEGFAWWWMNPALSGMGQPVLEYQPQVRGQEAGVSGQEEALAQSSSPNQKSTIKNQDSKISSSPTAHRSLITDHFSTHTPLPALYRQAAPMLRCSSGEIYHVRRDDGISLYLAWFEWNDLDTGSVLEAFRHPPEACMGAIGMKLVSKERPIHYVVRGQDPVRLDRRAGPLVANGVESERIDQRSEIRGQASEVRGQVSEVRSQEESPVQSSSSTDHRPPTTDNSSTAHRSLLTDHSSSLTDQRPPTTDNSSTAHRSLLTDHSSSSLHSKSNIQNPKFATQSLSFSHSIFRDPGGTDSPLLPSPRVHSFRAVWVSGIPNADDKLDFSDHSLDHLRSIRLKSAFTRYRPRHARVIQGTVRGALNTESAWAAFEQSMLQHLTIETQTAVPVIR
jgi:hypothetical protein